MSTHYEIAEDGRVERVEIQRTRLLPSPAFYNQISSDLKLKSPMVTHTPSGRPVRLVLSTNYHFACWQVVTIPIHTAFSFLDVAKVFVPDFRGSKTSVRMKLDWQPPMTVMIGFDMGYSANHVEVGKVYLCAFSGGSQYRLPLANTYDTCELCTGEFNRVHRDLVGCVAAVENQFQSSLWNADLWSACEQTSAMFRWKANKDKMEQQPIDRNWTDLCFKVSVHELTYLEP